MDNEEMSILIKGMEMPKSCEECVIEGHYENSYGDEFGFFCPFGYKAYTRGARDSGRLDDCPLIEVPEDVQPVKHARWIPGTLSNNKVGNECSVCHAISVGAMKPHYCPNCGADMRGE